MPSSSHIPYGHCFYKQLRKISDGRGGDSRDVRRHWPLAYEPALWSVVFPLGMYSVATQTFGKSAHLAFMTPIARVMLWVAVAAWLAVAVAFAIQITRFNKRNGLK
jgi:tellurite resistance protein TehA-like permease